MEGTGGQHDRGICPLAGTVGHFSMFESELTMKITERIKALPGVEDCYWNASENRLSVYYFHTETLNAIQVKVSGALADGGVREAVDTITFIKWT